MGGGAIWVCEVFFDAFNEEWELALEHATIKRELGDLFIVGWMLLSDLVFGRNKMKP
jgi:hypothetical protein